MKIKILFGFIISFFLIDNLFGMESISGDDIEINAINFLYNDDFKNNQYYINLLTEYTKGKDQFIENYPFEYAVLSILNEDKELSFEHLSTDHIYLLLQEVFVIENFENKKKLIEKIINKLKEKKIILKLEDLYFFEDIIDLIKKNQENKKLIQLIFDKWLNYISSLSTQGVQEAANIVIQDEQYKKLVYSVLDNLDLFLKSDDLFLKSDQELKKFFDKGEPEYQGNTVCYMMLYCAHHPEMPEKYSNHLLKFISSILPNAKIQISDLLFSFIKQVDMEPFELISLLNNFFSKNDDMNSMDVSSTDQSKSNIRYLLEELTNLKTKIQCEQLIHDDIKNFIALLNWDKENNCLVYDKEELEEDAKKEENERIYPFSIKLLNHDEKDYENQYLEYFIHSSDEKWLQKEKNVKIYNNIQYLFESYASKIKQLEEFPEKYRQELMIAYRDWKKKYIESIVVEANNASRKVINFGQKSFGLLGKICSVFHNIINSEANFRSLHEAKLFQAIYGCDIDLPEIEEKIKEETIEIDLSGQFLRLEDDLKFNITELKKEIDQLKNKLSEGVDLSSDGAHLMKKLKKNYAEEWIAITKKNNIQKKSLDQNTKEKRDKFRKDMKSKKIENEKNKQAYEKHQKKLNKFEKNIKWDELYKIYSALCLIKFDSVDTRGNFQTKNISFEELQAVNNNLEAYFKVKNKELFDYIFEKKIIDSSEENKELFDYIFEKKIIDSSEETVKNKIKSQESKILPDEFYKERKYIIQQAGQFFLEGIDQLLKNNKIEDANVFNSFVFFIELFKNNQELLLNNLISKYTTVIDKLVPIENLKIKFKEKDWLQSDYITDFAEKIKNESDKKFNNYDLCLIYLHLKLGKVIDENMKIKIQSLKDSGNINKNLIQKINKLLNIKEKKEAGEVKSEEEETSAREKPEGEWIINKAQFKDEMALLMSKYLQNKNENNQNGSDKEDESADNKEEEKSESSESFEDIYEVESETVTVIKEKLPKESEISQDKSGGDNLQSFFTESQKGYLNNFPNKIKNKPTEAITLFDMVIQNKEDNNILKFLIDKFELGQYLKQDYSEETTLFINQIKNILAQNISSIKLDANQENQLLNNNDLAHDIKQWIQSFDNSSWPFFALPFSTVLLLAPMVGPLLGDMKLSPGLEHFIFKLKNLIEDVKLDKLIYRWGQLIKDNEKISIGVWTSITLICLGKLLQKIIKNNALSKSKLKIIEKVIQASKINLVPDYKIKLFLNKDTPGVQEYIVSYIYELEKEKESVAEKSDCGMKSAIEECDSIKELGEKIKKNKSFFEPIYNSEDHFITPGYEDNIYEERKNAKEILAKKYYKLLLTEIKDQEIKYQAIKDQEIKEIIEDIAAIPFYKESESKIICGVTERKTMNNIYEKICPLYNNFLRTNILEKNKNIEMMNNPSYVQEFLVDLFSLVHEDKEIKEKFLKKNGIEKAEMIERAKDSIHIMKKRDEGFSQFMEKNKISILKK